MLVRRRPLIDGGLLPRRCVGGVAGRARFKAGWCGGLRWRLWREVWSPQKALTDVPVFKAWRRVVGGGLGDRPGLFVLDLILQVFGLWCAAKQRLGWQGGVSSMGLGGSPVSVWFWDRNIRRTVYGIWAGAVMGRELAGVQRWRWVCFWPRYGCFGVEVTGFVTSDLLAAGSGKMEAALWRRKGDRGGPSVYFVRVLFCGCWFGQISPYSFELGLGLFVVPWLWWFSWGLIVSTSVCFCRQYAGIQSLHVVWYVLERGVEEGVVIMAVVYEVLSELSGLFFISSPCGRFLWLKVGPFWLIWIVSNDLHVTNIIYRDVRGSPTA